MHALATSRLVGAQPWGFRPQNRRPLLAPFVPRVASEAVGTGSPNPASNSVESLLRRYDADGDGRLTIEEAQKALLDYQLQSRPASAPTPVVSSVAAAPTAAPSRGPLSWDMQLYHGWRDAKACGKDPFSCMATYVQQKLTNSGKVKVSFSDVVWSALGMYLAVAALGVMNVYAKSWPIVGQWHQQGLNLLLGSFGTLCVLIFGNPDAAPVKLWNMVAGHVISTFLVLVLIHAFGPCIFSRATAMAVMIATMLLTDCIHPPGGALVLMAVDSTAIQKMDWWFMLYPSLTITLALLLPLGLGVNWLKRNVKFDFPSAAPADQPLGGLHPKAA